MQRKALHAKIHRATVTERHVEYVGSVTVDEELLRAADIRPNEVVLVADMDNGARFETYVMRGEPGSGVIGVNGAAARLVGQGHRIILFAHVYLGPRDLDDHQANIVIVDGRNGIQETRSASSAIQPPLPQ